MKDFFRRLSRYRSLDLTPEGIRFLLLTLGVGAGAVNTGHNLLYLFFAMMLSLIIISGILSEQCFRGIDIRRRLPAHLFANCPSSGSFVITNRKTQFPTFSLTVMDIMSGQAVDRGLRLFHLPPGAAVRHRYPLHFDRRGRYRFVGIKLLTRFPFGFFIKGAPLPSPSELLVYPQIRSLPDALFDELRAQGHGELVLLRGQGAELHNLKLYQPGDDSRAIHWKTTARKAQLIVRETDTEQERRVVLLLDNGRRPQIRHESTSEPAQQLFEQAVTLTASLAQFFHQRRYQIRLLVGEEELPYGIGDAHFHRLLTLLALCRQADTPSSSLLSSLKKLAGKSEYSIVVLSESDPSILGPCRGVSHVLMASDLA